MNREEALKKIRQMSLPKETMEILEALAPELSESEGERILASIADCVGLMGEDGNVFSNHNVTKVQVLAYLEKQKEQNGEDEECTDFTIYHPLKNGKGEYDCIPFSFYGSLASFYENKDLIDFLHTSFYTEEECNEWIKQQKEQKESPKSSDSIPSDCTSDAKCEDRWHKVGDSLPDNGRLVLAKDCLGNVLLARYDGENWEVNVYDNEDHYCHNSISKWCEIPSEKQKEQKPAEVDESTKRLNDNWIKQHFDDYKEQKPIECELEDAFKYYTDAGITISCGDIVAKPKEQKPADEAEKFFDSAESYNQGFVAGQKKMKEDIEKGFGIGEHSLDYLAGRYAGYTAAKKEQKLEWSDTNELVFQDICKHLKEEGYSGWVVLLNALRNGEFQPKQEWSEEDEKMLQSIIKDFRAGKVSTIGQERWLKSLRPQQRQEWSEEEKEILDSILSHYVLIDKPIDANGIPKEKYISLIKSIRFDTYKNCNSHWKPSDEQMQAVKHAYNSFPNDCLTKSNLRLLYHDLEKLM